MSRCWTRELHDGGISKSDFCDQIQTSTLVVLDLKQKPFKQRGLMHYLKAMLNNSFVIFFSIREQNFDLFCFSRPIWEVKKTSLFLCYFSHSNVVYVKQINCNWGHINYWVGRAIIILALRLWFQSILLKLALIELINKWVKADKGKRKTLATKEKIAKLQNFNAEKSKFQ